ncbi:hypothetical protein J6590_083394 [Homalodisca vitripennis]|nr:hypothetical protein J6590_083394 [Homalodisca vitripennis]
MAPFSSTASETSSNCTSGTLCVGWCIDGLKRVERHDKSEETLGFPTAHDDHCSLARLLLGSFVSGSMDVFIDASNTVGRSSVEVLSVGGLIL